MPIRSPFALLDRLADRCADECLRAVDAFNDDPMTQAYGAGECSGLIIQAFAKKHLRCCPLCKERR